MARKRKSQQAHSTRKPPEKHTKKPPNFPPNWWNTPLFTSPKSYVRTEKIGYAITAILFLCLIAYFIKGYSIRPRILDDGLVARIINPSQNADVSIYKIGPEGSMKHARTQEGKEGLFFQVNPGESVGFFISRDSLNIPEDARTIGLSISNAYKGCPTFNYGFTNKAPHNDVKNIGKFLPESIAAKTEMIPSMDTMRYVLAMAHFYSPDTFEIPWSKAKYFYGFYTASDPTELFLDKIFILEK